MTKKSKLSFLKPLKNFLKRCFNTQTKEEPVVVRPYHLLNRRILGVGEHRSGWPLVMHHLSKNAGGEILLDDFVEQSFVYPLGRLPAHKKPWVGFIHHPAETVHWQEYLALEYLFAQEGWQKSVPYLIGMICLSESLAQRMRREYPGIPVKVIKHPTQMKVPQWRGGNRLLQAGACGRNIRLIYQFPACEGWNKVRLLANSPWMTTQDQKCAFYTTRVELDSTVQRIRRVDDKTYDELLASSVVICELIVASANNVIIECIARATPIIVNRHTAAIEYLGEDYPLYFDDPEEIPGMLSSEKLFAANAHLKALQKEPWLQVDKFVEDVSSFIASIRHRAEEYTKSSVEANTI